MIKKQPYRKSKSALCSHTGPMQSVDQGLGNMNENAKTALEQCPAKVTATALEVRERMKGGRIKRGFVNIAISESERSVKRNPIGS